ncbi:MAG TPA: HK97 gp10 family phage protein [Aeromicrobium sp.]|nr:HK97 gp10 family phage protein [Aeromicrobium sp.]HKY57664.1 HK97 gp10 family phage protein [Aeromicrobium sp.]
MARTRVTLNRRGIQEYLDGQHGMEAVLDAEATESLERAQDRAPVATGAYRDSLHIETDRTDRMVKRVVSGVSYAIVVEARTGNLTRSLR